MLPAQTLRQAQGDIPRRLTARSQSEFIEDCA
jgi:hypothetical protein